MLVSSDKERKDAKLALLYNIRLIFTSGINKTYTVDEITELLDKLAATIQK